MFLPINLSGELHLASVILQDLTSIARKYEARQPVPINWATPCCIFIWHESTCRKQKDMATRYNMIQLCPQIDEDFLTASLLLLYVFFTLSRPIQIHLPFVFDKRKVKSGGRILSSFPDREPPVYVPCQNLDTWLFNGRSSESFRPGGCPFVTRHPHLIDRINVLPAFMLMIYRIYSYFKMIQG